MLGNAIVNPVVPAQDLARAKAWYAEHLGLEPAVEAEGGLVYVCRRSWFFLFQSSGGSGDATALEFFVADLDSSMSELRERGVVFEDYQFPEWGTVDGVAESSEGRSAWLKDSEGNTIALTELIEAGMIDQLLAMTSE